MTPKDSAADPHAATALADALWLADLASKKAWETYECGHGATVTLTCPARCAAHRRMVRLHRYIYGESDA